MGRGGDREPREKNNDLDKCIRVTLRTGHRGKEVRKRGCEPYAFQIDISRKKKREEEKKSLTLRDQFEAKRGGRPKKDRQV